MINHSDFDVLEQQTTALIDCVIRLRQQNRLLLQQQYELNQRCQRLSNNNLAALEKLKTVLQRLKNLESSP